MLSRFATALLLIAVSLSSPGHAHADDPPVTCLQYDADGICIVVAPGDSSQGGTSSGGGGGAARCVDANTHDKVLCVLDSGASWNVANNCYVLLMRPQPSPDELDPYGKPLGTHPGMAAFMCSPPPTGASGGAYPFSYTPYVVFLSVAPPVDPLVLARQAISQMNLTAITVGMVPEPLPGRVGIIGLPQWMWAENPSPNTVGPITRSASSGGSTVTATGTVTRIVWDMGDGSTVTCTGPGTRYEDRYGKSPSPTCGYRYTKQGEYTVRATSYWEVAWNGIGRSGTIPLTFTSTATITMGEVQVLRR